MAKITINYQDKKFEISDSKTLNQFTVTSAQFKQMSADENKSPFSIASHNKKLLYYIDINNNVRPIIVIKTSKSYKFYAKDGELTSTYFPIELFTTKTEALNVLAEISKEELKEKFNNAKESVKETVENIKERIEPVRKTVKGFTTIAGALLNEFTEKAKDKASTALNLDNDDNKAKAQVIGDSIRARYDRIMENIRQSRDSIGSFLLFRVR